MCVVCASDRKRDKEIALISEIDELLRKYGGWDRRVVKGSPEFRNDDLPSAS